LAGEIVKKYGIIFLFVIVYLSCFQCGEDRFDIIIRNGTIVDGTGNPYYRSDIGIRKGKIVKIGRIEEKGGKRVIDAKNLMVTPGFIDVHTHIDDGVLRDPTAHNYITQGVTTVIGGNCGSSPIDLKEYFEKVKSQGIALNVGCLIGHNSIRTEVMGSEDRAPTQEDLTKMKELVEKGMKAGALGLSSGLKYTPGAYTETEEIIELAKIAANYGGIYATHLREEGLGVVNAVREAIEIGAKAKIQVLISHHKVMSADKWGESKITLQLIEDARRRGIDVRADQYPYPATSTGLTVLFPPWALDGGRKKLVERLENSEQNDRIKEEIKFRMVHDRGGPDLDNIMIAFFKYDSTFEGLSLKGILNKKGLEVNLDNGAQLVIDMVKQGGASAIYRCLSDEDIERIMKDPVVMHSSDGAVVQFGKGVPHPRNYGSFPRVYAQYVRKKKVLSFDEAVRKMTSLPASTIGINDRGTIKEKLWADIVIFDPEKIRDRATFSNPHQYSEGIHYVLVNGVIVVENEKITGRLPGKINYGNKKNRPVE